MLPIILQRQAGFAPSMILRIGVLLLMAFSLTLSHARPLVETDVEKSQIKQIESDLSREKEKFLRFGNIEEGLLGQLSNIEKRIAVQQEFLKVLAEKIRFNKKILNNEQGRLKQVEFFSAKIQKRLGKRLSAFYKYAKRGYVQLLATSEDLGQLRRRMQYLKIIMGEDQRLLNEMFDIKSEFKTKVSLIKGKMAVINNLEKTESERLSWIKGELEKKVLLLMKIHSEKEFYRTAVNELEVASKNLRDKLLNLERINKKKKILSSRFAASKGKLPLPFEGKIIRSNNQFRSGSLKHNKGIFIQGPIGAEVKTIFPGRVDFSGWLKGYGQIIVVNHGSRFFSISAHLSQRNKQDGDIVEKGTVIGLLGQTESLSGPGLYFELRRGGKNLYPLKWLKVN